MGNVTINIDLDKKCKRCAKGGALPNGYCLKCMTKFIQEGKLDYILKRKKEDSK